MKNKKKTNNKKTIHKTIINLNLNGIWLYFLAKDFITEHQAEIIQYLGLLI